VTTCAKTAVAAVGYGVSLLAAAGTPESMLAEHWPLLLLLSSGFAALAYVSRQTIGLYKAAKVEVELLAKSHADAAAKTAVEAHVIESSTRNRRLVEDHVSGAIREAGRDWRATLLAHTHEEERRFSDIDRKFDKVISELRFQRGQNDSIIATVRSLAGTASHPGLLVPTPTTLDSSPGKTDGLK
jgi:hypothetical protein